MNHNQINISFLLLVSIISLCTSNYTTFNLQYEYEDFRYVPFFIDGKCENTKYNIGFAVSLLSPVIGYYGEYYPIDYMRVNGTTSFLNFINMKEMETGKKAEGKILLFDSDNSNFTSNITAYLYDDNLFTFFNSSSEAILGLSYSMSSENAKGFNKSETTWEILKKNKNISKIFSINIRKQKYTSQLYLGGKHENFDKEENVATFDILNKNSPFWNIAFSKMTFNNKNISLLINDKPYEIRFMLENNKIIFPKQFKDLLIDDKCKIIDTNIHGELFTCNYDSNKTLPITFYNSNNSNETIVLEGEVDNIKNIYPAQCGEIEKIFGTNINFTTYEDNYIYMPLYVFKQFHVLFDGTKDQIKFYTENQTLLQKINKTEPTKEPEVTLEEALANLETLETYVKDYKTTFGDLTSTEQLISSYIREGEQNDLIWSMIIGTCPEKLLTYIEIKEKEKQTKVAALKDYKDVTVSEGVKVDFVHLFSVIYGIIKDGSYTSDMAGLLGWAGDLAQLMKDIEYNTGDYYDSILNTAKEFLGIKGNFRRSILISDLDAPYIVKLRNGSGKSFASILKEYYTNKEINMVVRIQNFIGLIFPDVKVITQGVIRDNVYNSYSGNTYVKRIECSYGFRDKFLRCELMPLDLFYRYSDFPKAVSHAFADYLYQNTDHE